MIILVTILATLNGLTQGEAIAEKPIPEEQKFVPITKQAYSNSNDGNYKFSYEAGNGISVQEEGSLKNRGTDQEAQTAHGSYSYTAPNGQFIVVNWYADETGFHADGVHIPTSKDYIPQSGNDTESLDHKFSRFMPRG